MADNFLQLNNKTEVIIFSPSKTKNPIFTDRGTLTSFNLLHELWVSFLILILIKNSFYQLRIISKIKHSLSYHNLGKSYPCSYNITAGLLQLPLAWSPPVPHITSPNGSECSSNTIDWVKKVGAYHTHSCIPSQAASTTKDPFQDSSNGVQSLHRSGPILHLRPFTPPLSLCVPKIL